MGYPLNCSFDCNFHLWFVHLKFIWENEKIDKKAKNPPTETFEARIT